MFSCNVKIAYRYNLLYNSIMSKLLNLALAAELSLAGCAAPLGSEQLPQPMPMPGATSAPGPEATKPCADVLDHERLQVIVRDQVGVVTVRLTGTECVAVYKPFSEERIGNLAAGSVFSGYCRGALNGTQESWFVKYGPEYKQSGAIYVAGAPDPSEGESPGFGCDVIPYLGYVTAK